MALYHKHRPQNFASVIGQEPIVITLSNQVATQKVAHAYLFSGPRGVGKTTLARILAKAVNCENRKTATSEPCGQCSSCQEISESRSIDVIEIDAASHTGVDNVRENIIDNAQFKPTKSKYKIFIIDEVHMLSTSAFNALLKTLEEPPTHVIFILATTELHKLPETIISRCQRFGFKKVDFETLKKHLQNIAKDEGIKIDKEVVERIVGKSDGCVRDGVSLLDQLMASGEKHLTLENSTLILPSYSRENVLRFIGALINNDTASGVDLLNKQLADGVNLNEFANDTIELLRQMMILKTVGAQNYNFDLSDADKKEVNKLNLQITPVQFVALIDLLMKRATQIKSAPLPQLPLEMALVEWCKNTDDADFYTDVADHADKKVEKKAEPVIKKEEFEKKSITQKVKELVHKAEPFGVNEVHSCWNNFIQKIEVQYPSLSFILKMSHLLSVSDNTLKLGVGFGFHRDKLMEKRCQSALENILSELLTTKAKLEIVVVENSDTVSKETDDLQELASSLGGEVVN